MKSNDMKKPKITSTQNPDGTWNIDITELVREDIQKILDFYSEDLIKEGIITK